MSLGTFVGGGMDVVNGLGKGLAQAKSKVGALAKGWQAFRGALGRSPRKQPAPRLKHMYWGVFCQNGHYIALWGLPTAFSGPRYATMLNDRPLDYRPEDRIVCPNCLALVAYPMAAEELKVVESDKILKLYRPNSTDDDKGGTEAGGLKRYYSD